MATDVLHFTIATCMFAHFKNSEVRKVAATVVFLEIAWHQADTVGRISHE